MTEKAQNIISRMRKRDRRRILSRLKDPKHRNHLIGDINLLDQDDPSRMGGGDQEVNLLTEMNELQRIQNDNWSRGPADTLTMDELRDIFPPHNVRSMASRPSSPSLRQRDETQLYQRRDGPVLWTLCSLPSRRVHSDAPLGL